MIMYMMLKLSLLIVFYLLSAFFSGIETALTSLSTLNLKNLKEKFNHLRKILDFWERDPGKLISTTLIGTNLFNIGIGVLTISICIDLVNEFGLRAKLVYVAVPLFSVFITLVFCEILPKVYSRYKAEYVAVKGMGFLMVSYRMFALPNRLLLAISNFIIGLTGSSAKSEMAFLGPDELKILFLADDTIPISKPARSMIKNIFDFGKTRIKNVMVPRAEICAVNLDQDSEKIMEQIIEKGYSRVPVFRGNLDNIVGIIYSKDLSLAWRGGSLFVIDDLIRPAYFVPDSARLDKVLREFKSGHQHMAIVVNEFGSAIGLVTIEDIVERIVGEIWDEYDIHEHTIFPLPDGSFLISAGESLEHTNDELHLNLPAGEFSSVGGWVLDMFGRIPKAGETIKWGTLEIEIAEADKRKILKVKIKKL
ncbi:MAG: hemolysin family protein [Elusimicrobiota bacterium]